jgi:hypothetical protein
MASLHVSLASILVQPLPTFFSEGQFKNLCVKFSFPSHEEKTDITVPNGQIEQLEKQLFVHFLLRWLIE